MKNPIKITLFAGAAAFLAFGALRAPEPFRSAARTVPTPTATPESAGFDQAAALERLRAQIKGKEREPAESVFKNIRSMNGIPAGRLLAIMELGYARSLGVDCTHCHVPDQWDSEDRKAKRIAREMAAMSTQINGTLKGIKGIDNPNPSVNCTTCHRGQIKPALNLPK